MSDKQTPHRIRNSYFDLYYVIGTLQGYACGLEVKGNPDLTSVVTGLRDCAKSLEKIAITFGEEYDRN